MKKIELLAPAGNLERQRLRSYMVQMQYILEENSFHCVHVHLISLLRKSKS